MKAALCGIRTYQLTHHNSYFKSLNVFLLIARKKTKKPKVIKCKDVETIFFLHHLLNTRLLPAGLSAAHVHAD